jgi:hypothetical protein
MNAVTVTRRHAGENFDREDDEFSLPATVGPGDGHVRCGNHPAEWGIYHQSAAAVRACYQAAEAEAAQQAAEIWAENAWLRAAEAGTPDTWRDEDLERMAEACGLPVPPGFF